MVHLYSLFGGRTANMDILNVPKDYYLTIPYLLVFYLISVNESSPAS